MEFYASLKELYPEFAPFFLEIESLLSRFIKLRLGVIELGTHFSKLLQELQKLDSIHRSRSTGRISDDEISLHYDTMTRYIETGGQSKEFVEDPDKIWNSILFMSQLVNYAEEKVRLLNLIDKFAGAGYAVKSVALLHGYIHSVNTRNLYLGYFCLRGEIEILAVAHHQTTATLGEMHPAEMLTRAMRAPFSTFAPSQKNKLPHRLNVLTAIDQLDREKAFSFKDKTFRSIYEDLSEIVHPNMISNFLYARTTAEGGIEFQWQAEHNTWHGLLKDQMDLASLCFKETLTRVQQLIQGEIKFE